MVPQALLDRVAEAAREHCAALGYESGPNWNPLTPHDPVAALAMARTLVASKRFDSYLVVAPEGHIYGYFFALFGVSVLSVFVDYPPTEVTTTDDLEAFRGRRVLVLEDDVVSGTSLRMVMAMLESHSPASMALYLGRRADGQFTESIPAGISTTYIAEIYLNPADRSRHEAEFVAFFTTDRFPPLSPPG